MKAVVPFARTAAKASVTKETARYRAVSGINEPEVYENMSKQAITDMRTCMIVDATYSPMVPEDLDEDIGEEDLEFSEYKNAVVLLLQDVETFNVFHCPLSAENVKELARLDTEPTPRQLIKFAEALRGREAPVTLLVSPDSDLVTPEMVKKLQKKGLLNNEASMKRFEEAKEKRRKVLEEQESIPQSEYEEFMAAQDEMLQDKFQQWKQEKEEAKRRSVFLEIDNIEEEDTELPIKTRKKR